MVIFSPIIARYGTSQSDVFVQPRGHVMARKKKFELWILTHATNLYDVRRVLRNSYNLWKNRSEKPVLSVYSYLFSPIQTYGLNLRNPSVTSVEKTEIFDFMWFLSHNLRNHMLQWFDALKNPNKNVYNFAHNLSIFSAGKNLHIALH